MVSPWTAVAGLALVGLTPLNAQEPLRADNSQPESQAERSRQDLAEMKLEDLMKLEVTSVSKTSKPISQVAAAVFVITQEDIRNSGATNFPDLLRMVPGMNVAQINASTWAVSIRGFNEQFANKLLVMVDGRTVYVPTFGGVFWDVADLPLENIERIEVLRGPGGAVWGGNAVNGVINILTKKASQTKGILASFSSGNTHNEIGLVQYGGAAGPRVDYRLFTKFLNEGALETETGGTNGDGWHVLRGGMRADARLSSRDTLSVLGDIYSGRKGVTTAIESSITAPTALTRVQENLSGGFLQGVWNRQTSEDAGMKLSVSYDHFGRMDALRERRATLDIDFQHSFAFGERNKFTWGFDYRFSDSDTGGLVVSYFPDDLHWNLYSGFVQDEVILREDKLYLTLGTKLEQNDFSGFSAMPNVRLAWTPNKRTTLWAALSKAERTPSELDSEGFRANLSSIPSPSGLPLVVSVFGTAGFQNERLLAYEAGYRAALRKNLSLDFAAYYNDYDQLRSFEPGAPFPELTPAPPHIVLPFYFENKMFGETHGFEVFGEWKITPRWQVNPGYSFERMHLHLQPSSLDTTAPFIQGSTPVHSAQLRSHLALGKGVAWDISAYFTDRLTSQQLASHTRLDTQLSWNWRGLLRVGVVGQNLAQRDRPEFHDTDPNIRTSLVKRSAYAQVTLRY